ncbi:universal stress protein [Cognatishimia activa]|uniref:Universal stress protein UspG n=1 Tax=Cognatishimia activa TaxID=1715691 RepID=A0A0P1ILG6_9RHOB|nr:universal stress protein [Cognatishimia activa]MEE2944066.1 universal stress protein [Pseudomonadota bacterium]CUI54978.1 universal stress protein UspG [Cognatishimia activa]CUK24350.1 universal stress protein UspG [Cognatishimia activa]
MSEKFAVGFDGSDAAKRALEFAIGRAKAQGGSVVLIHVLEWSPYSFLTPSELEERHKRRQEELDRAETALMKPVLKEIKDSGVSVETIIKYGHIADTLNEVAGANGATQIVIGRNGHSNLSSRVFGSVAGSLVQTSSVPCTIVP